MAVSLRLLAEEGLQGASIRRIVKSAGGSNISALHYHFGDRQALVAALASSVFEKLQLETMPRLAALSVRAHTVRNVLEAMFMPLLELRARGDEGRHAVQFLARLSWEFGPEGQALSAAGLNEIAETAIQKLIALLPDINEDHLRLKLLMAMTNVFHGLADFNYVVVAPFGPRNILRASEAGKRAELMFDYLEAGVRSNPKL